MNLVLRTFTSRKTGKTYRIRSRISREETKKLLPIERQNYIYESHISPLVISELHTNEFFLKEAQKCGKVVKEEVEEEGDEGVVLPKDEITPEQGLELLQKQQNEIREND